MGTPCNMTDCPGFKVFWRPSYIYILIGTIGPILVISLSLNIYFCVSKYCSGKRGRKQRRSPTQMEDNPIYGNISYTQENTTAVFTEGNRPHSTLSSSSVRDQQRSKTQDCYANLALKPPRLQSGRSSPQIQYSDVIQLEVPVQAETQNEGNHDAGVPALSDLYASVPSQRVKVNTADTGEDYANQLCSDTDDNLA